MIRIACAATYAPERKYILEVMLRDFLGLDYRVQVEDRPDWRLCLDENPGAGAIYVPDVLFRVPTEDWLTPSSMPRETIARCSTNQTPHETSNPEAGLPVLYGSQSEPCGIRKDGADLRLAVDMFGSSFFMLTRLEELVLDGSYEYGRFPASLSSAKRLGFLHRPLVNEYLELLWSAMQLLWPQLERKPRQYRLWSTYDVDLPTAVAWRPLGAVISSAAAVMFQQHNPQAACRRLKAYSRTRRGDLSADPYWTFEQLMEASESHGQASTFYFLPDESVFSIERPEIISLIKQIRERGHFIGVHPPLDSHQRPETVLRAKKAVERAKKNMVLISLKGDTIPHEVLGHYGAGKVLLKPASEGTGLIAGGASRSVLEVVGVRNVLCKSLGSSNPHNVVSATIDGLTRLRNVAQIAALRGRTAEELA